MKKINLLLTLALAVILASCSNNSLNYPTKSQYNYGLNSTITLIPGYNEFNTLDYITDVTKVDSVTSDFQGVQAKLSEDKSKVILDVIKMPNIVNVALWVEGVPYSIICKRTDKIDYTFRYNPNGKKFNRVQLAGQMNDWVPSFHPDLTLNSDGIYEVTINVSPGTYMYQLVRDGDWNHDETNPEKVDNNSGKFNSILHIPSRQDEAPILLTDSYDDSKVFLSLTNELGQIYVYWENYLLPANFLYISEKEIGITIPEEAKNIKRSYIRAIAYNKYGTSNDILIPLEYGKVISDVKQVTRFDKHADVLYSLMVDRFKDGNPENNKPMNRKDVDPRADYQGGDLAGITEVIKSGYFEKMGFTTIWMTPLNQNPLEPYGEQMSPVRTKFSGYHGYWPISSTKVDFRIGTEKELKELTKTAHEHGLNVILDYVANHVHKEHPMFKNDTTICTPLILPDGSRNIAQWNEHRLTTWFDDFLPTLNYDRKEIVETMTDSALYWIKNYDLDGFRHDACKHVQESFWRTLTYKIKTQVEIPENKPFYQVGESYGSPQLISSYVNSGMLNGQFDFNTSDDASAVFALNSEDFHRVSNTLNTSLRVYGSHNLMGYISGNHDRGRFISYASGSLKYGEDAKAVGWQREVGVGDPAGYDKIVQLNAFNLTIPGVPVIYYGDEFGMPGANDPDCRRMMRFGDDLNEKEQTTLESVAKLGQLRKNNLPLIYGDFIELYLTNTEWAYARNYFGEIVITVFNRNLEEKEIQIPLPKLMQDKKFETTFGSDFNIENGILTIKVKGNGVDVLTEK